MTPPPDTTLSPRRRVILDAATEVLDGQGLRGLTHRSVDRAAGLPEGTTSATWADPDHLFVVSEESGGSTVSLCSLDGSCDTLAESAGPVVLGS